MAIRKIRTYPDEVLKKKAEPVQEVTDELRRLADDMIATMYSAPGVGLAAPQVGVSKRLIVLDPGSLDESQSTLLVLFNPEVISTEGEMDYEEGCLSVPEFTVTIRRAERVSVAALDREGNEVKIDAEGMLAIVLQHEIDHLEGTLILDRSSSLKREFYKKRVLKQLAKVG